MTPTDRGPLKERLFARASAAAPREATYAILDAARDEAIFAAVTRSGLEHASLYEGADDALRAVSPHLVQLHPEAALSVQLLESAWGRSWGVFARTTSTFAELRRHLRTFLRVKIHDGRIVYFRYYDPRVLRTYLPTCTLDELKQVFGPVREFLMEGEDGRALLSFELAIDFHGRLSLAQERVALPAPDRS